MLLVSDFGVVLDIRPLSVGNDGDRPTTTNYRTIQLATTNNKKQKSKEVWIC